VKRIRIAEVIIKGVDLLDKVRKCEVRDDKVESSGRNEVSGYKNVER